MKLKIHFFTIIIIDSGKNQRLMLKHGWKEQDVLYGLIQIQSIFLQRYLQITKKNNEFSVKTLSYPSDKHHICNLLLNDLEKTIKHIQRKQ